VTVPEARLAEHPLPPLVVQEIPAGLLVTVAVPKITTVSVFCAVAGSAQSSRKSSDTDSNPSPLRSLRARFNCGIDI